MVLDDLVLKKRKFPTVGVYRVTAPEADWKTRIETNKMGKPMPGFHSALVALEFAPEWHGVFSKNEFTGEILVAKKPPYIEGEEAFKPRQLKTEDIGEIRAWMSQRYGISASPADIEGIAVTLASRNTIHPLREYLVSLKGKWDGERRLNGFLSHYFGVEESRYTEAVSSKTLIGCVARAMEPGCQMDNMLIIEGEGGIGKSTGIRALMPDQSWYTDSLPDIQNKDAAIQIQGVWILELAELAGHSRRETEAQKAFITRVSDRFRPPFEKASQHHPRYTVFIGTTNREQYLVDETGNRRYWPVRATHVDVAGIKADRDQIWAEAVYAWLEGEAWHLVGDEVGLARSEQRNRFDDDPWTDAVLGFVNGRDIILRDELVSALGVEMKNYKRSEANRIGAIMKVSGYEAFRVGSGTDRGKYAFRRKEQ